MGYNGDSDFAFRALEGGSTISYTASNTPFNGGSLTPFLLSGINSVGVEERSGQRTVSMVNSNGAFPNAVSYYVGRTENDYFNGRLSEVIVYRRNLGASEGQKLKSYLAIKYGLSLGQGVAQNYVSSSDVTIWDAASVGPIYNHDITAIGQDDGFPLDQTRSKSSNSQSILTIAENGGGMSDGEFLFWSHNEGTRSFVSNELPSGIDQRLEREWLVQETGEVGSVDISFDLSGVSMPLGVDLVGEYFLLYDSDEDFSSDAQTLVASSVAGSVVTFAGVHEDVLDHGWYLTLGVRDLPAPGGVDSGIQLWLRADSGTSTTTDGVGVTQWNDQSGHLRHSLEGTNPPLFKNDVANTVNQYPTLLFDGADDQLITTLESLEGISNYSVFAVGVRGDEGINDVLGSDLAKEAFFFGYHGSQDFGFRALSAGASIQFAASPFGFDSPTQTPFLLEGVNSEGREERNGTATLNSLNSNGAFPDAATYYVGRGENRFYNGGINEIIVFDRELDAASRRKITSYLALKYGISLDQGGAGQDYVNSADQVVWDADGVPSGYNNGISGVGVDERTGLMQMRSQSSNNGSVVAVDASGGGMTDGEFLLWSHDGGGKTFSDQDVPIGIDSRLSRRWFVSETGEVGSVDVSFDLTGVPLSGGAAQASNFYLLTDADGTFASSASSLVASSLTGRVVSFTGVPESVLEQGTYFTLGCAFGGGGKVSPGGLMNELVLWLKADAITPAVTDGSGLSSWTDQSWYENHATAMTNPPTYRDNAADNINFNPTVSFDGTDDVLSTSLAVLEGRTQFAFFAVGTRGDGGVNAILGSDLSPDRFFFGYDQAQSFAFRANTGGGVFSTMTPWVFDDPAVTPFLLFGTDGAEQEERNGQNTIATDDDSGTFPDAGAYYLGRSAAEYFNGRLSELIVFDGGLSPGERQQLVSYLAIKYGLTLGQNNGNQQYVNASGAVLWDPVDVGASFTNRIAAIGQDDKSGLNQTQSKSVASDAILTVSKNGGAIGDGNFLVWSSNGAGTNFSTSDIPTGVQQRLDQVWVANETGEVGSVDLSFDLSELSLPSIISSPAQFFLIHDDDGVFASGAGLLQASSFSGNVVSFSGIDQDLLDGKRYFTLGLLTFNGPAGIISGIEMWLKADSESGVASDGAPLITWRDQSGLGNDATEMTHPPTYRNNSTDNINSHPNVYFDGVDDSLSVTLNGLAGSSEFSVFVVGKFEIGGVGVGSFFPVFIPVIGPDASLDPFGLVSFQSAISGRAIQAGGFTNIGSIEGPYKDDSVSVMIFDNGLRGFYNSEPSVFGTQSIIDVPDSGLPNLSTFLIAAPPAVQSDSQYLKGAISELIVYRDMIPGESSVYELSPTAERVWSYLAIKYGVPIHERGLNSMRYRDSSGTVIWERPLSSLENFTGNIAGIGRDDVSGLHQFRSQSSASSAIVSIESNGSGMEDREFLLWARQIGGSLAFNGSSVFGGSLPSGVDQALSDGWQVQETGEVGPVDLSFDLSSLTVPAGADTAANFVLLTATALNPGEGGGGVWGVLAGTSLANNTVTFSNVPAEMLQDNYLFTLGLRFNVPSTAVDDMVSRAPGTGVVKLLVADLLGNDSDADGDTISFDSNQLPASSANGSTLSLLSGGRWILYTPAETAPATPDTFSYTISDGNGHTDTATVTISVTVPNSQTRNNFRASVKNSDIELEFRGIPGRKYKVQSTTSLDGTIVWTDESVTVTAGVRGGIRFTDENAASQVGSKFYRTVEVNE